MQLSISFFVATTALSMLVLIYANGVHSGSDKSELIAEISIPYVKACDLAIEQRRGLIAAVEERNPIQFEVAKELFDVFPRSQESIQGSLRISARGRWKPVTPITPRKYLQTIGNNILDACMPNNSFVVPWEEIQSLRQRLEGYRLKSPQIRATDEGVLVEFNDGSYTAPKL